MNILINHRVEHIMDTEESLAIKIKKKQGEQVRLFLRNHGLLRTDLLIKKNKEFIFIPIKQSSDILHKFNIVSTSFEKTKQIPTQYQQLLDLQEEFQSLLPTSFDIIGDILLIKIPNELISYSSEIGKALLESHTQVNTVCNINPVKGELRRRSVTIIAGEHKTETIHKEYGLVFKVDVEKTYFSPRLATERKRISGLIENNACVFDMFCGVAPFSIMIASFANPTQIIGVDKNSDAIHLAEQNLCINNVEERIILINEDAKNSRKILNEFQMIPDNIIMNLPFSSFEFFPIAVRSIANNGMIHYYDIIKQENIEERIGQLKKIAENYQATLSEIVVHKIKTYAPHEFYIGLDITVSKN